MARKPQFDFDLIVIGSGAGGSPAASIAAAAGKSVAVVEADIFGGESPNWGDIPVKAFLHAVQLYDEARQGTRFGIRSAALGYNFMSMKTWKDLAVKRTGAGNNRKYYEQQGITTFHSPAHFLSPHEISINRRHLSAAKFLIATGSNWAIPEIIGLDKIHYHTPKTILTISRPPKSLLIIGGGSAAVEFAQGFAILGTKVYIAEKAVRILPHCDSEVSELMTRRLKEDKGVTVLTETRINSIQRDGLGHRFHYERGGVEKSVRIDEVLVTAGRTPAVDLGLENASVAYTPKGIDTDDYLQTSAGHIFAAGDVLGSKKHLHTALLESRVAANNLLHKQKLKPDYTAMPNITFTYPGIASVGMTEDDCLRRDLDVRKALVPLNMTARSNTSDFRDGFVKLIADKKGLLLGATIVAPHAGEMIHELALAIKHGMSAAELANTPHAFLSWSEAIRIAASKLA